jgi:hypothetical protein
MSINFDKMTDNVIAYTEELINKFGPRRAGSKASHDCANTLYEELNSFADDAKVEEFGVYTGAFLGWIRILVAFYTIGAAFLWLHMPIVLSLIHI